MRKLSDEHRKKISEALTGKKRPELLGVPRTDEVKRKISDAQKGRVFTDEHRKKISAAKLGQRRSDETRRKISDTRTAIYESRRRNMLVEQLRQEFYGRRFGV